MRKISITNKFIYYYLLMGLMTIIIISGLSFYMAKNALVERTYSHLTSVRTVNQKRVESFFNERIRELSLFSGSGEIKTIMADVEKHISDSEKCSEETGFSFLNKFLDSTENYNSLFIVHRSGMHKRIYGSDKSVLKCDSVICKMVEKMCIDVTTENKAIINEIRNNPNELPTVIIGYPLNSGHGNIDSGCLVCEINIAALNDIMFVDNPENGFGKTGESYLVGGDSLMRSNSRFGDPEVFNKKIISNAFLKAVNGESGAVECLDYRNILVYSSYGRINVDGLNWVIIAEIDVSEAMASVYSLLKRILLISLAIGIMVVFFTFIISKKFTKPIIKLKKAAEKIGEGEFDTYVSTASKDEIGMLTDTFNIMAEKLKMQTNQLKEREERLEHFYEATIDGIILHEEGTPLLINHAVSIMTGFKEDELERMKIKDLIDVVDQKSDFRVTLVPVTYETTCKRKYGKRFPVEVQEKSIEYKGRMVKALVIRDITKRSEVEQMLENERLKSFSWVIDGQEIERQRLSRELHDGLGQSLIAIKLRLEGAIDSADDKTRRTINEIRSLFDNAIDEVRRISNDLMPTGLQEFGIEVALRKLCSKLNESTGVEVVFFADNIPSKIDMKTTLYLYRISQEAINNSLKHAQASQISVSLYADENFIDLIVADDGKGFKFDMTHKYVGNGLYNMSERVSMLGGTYEVKSDIGKGTMIITKIPININENQ
jgi:PAS domain S-box-containing protein